MEDLINENDRYLVRAVVIYLMISSVSVTLTVTLKELIRRMGFFHQSGVPIG